MQFNNPVSTKNMTTLYLKQSIGRSPLRRGLFLIPLILAWFALAPTGQAQLPSPAPDGGYPGGNTAEGQNALFSLTTGTFNTAVGWLSLVSLTTGSFNTGVGAGTLVLNTGDENTATGVGALLLNTTGSLNTANGVQALFNNSTGSDNTATGFKALFNNSTGIFNTANGFAALASNQTGGFNTAIGYQALPGNTTGSFNTAAGNNSLFVNTTGQHNTAIGLQALSQNTTGSLNTALGISAGSGVTTADNVIAIGTSGENVANTCYIGNIFGVTSAGATAVYVNSLGKLGTVVSSRRFKDEIKPMDKASEAILALKPVSFRYKQEIDPARSPQFGLVAEDVEKVNPDLVVRDAEGKVNTVRYEAVNAMLLNEFLKEHRTVQGQQKEIDALKAELKEQAAQIQKVSAQLEASKPAPQVVNNP
jgi:Chaperone of endosialidase